MGTLPVGITDPAVQAINMFFGSMAAGFLVFSAPLLICGIILFLRAVLTCKPRGK